MNRRTLLATVLALGAVSCVLAQIGAEVPADAAEWAPGDALIYLGIADVNRTWDDFKQSAGYKLLSDPAAAEALPTASLASLTVRKLQERIAKALDTKVEQLKNPLAGPLTFYVRADAGGGADAWQLGLIAGVGDATIMKKYYDAAVTKLQEIATHTPESDGSQTIDVFKPKPAAERKDAATKEDEQFEKFSQPGGLAAAAKSPNAMIEEMLTSAFSADALPPSLAACLTNDRLIISDTAEHVRAILKREAGGETLAQTELHKALGQNLKPLGSVHFLVNLPRAIELMKAGGEPEKLGAVADVLKGAGPDTFESVKGIVGHFRVGAASYESKFEVLFVTGGARTGLAKLLSQENKPIAPPPTVSADTCLYMSANISAPKVLDDVDAFIRGMSAQTADKMKASLEAVPVNPETTVNLRQEFLDYLIGPVNLTLSTAKQPGPGSARAYVAIGHKDQNALNTFFGRMIGMLNPRDLRGTPAFDTVLPPGLTVVATPDRLLLGNGATLEGVLQAGTEQPLAQTDAWRNAARFVPEQAWLTIYSDNRKLMSAVIDAAQNKDDVAAPAPGLDLGKIIMGQMVSGMGAGATDPQQLRKFLKYAGQGILTISTTPQGIRLTQVELKPEG